MRRQIGLTLDNPEAVLAGADMTLSNIIQLGILRNQCGRGAEEFRPAGNAFQASQMWPTYDLDLCVKN